MVVYVRGESSVAPQLTLSLSDLSVFVLRYRNRAIQTFLLRVSRFFLLYDIIHLWHIRKEKKTSKNKLTSSLFGC